MSTEEEDPSLVERVASLEADMKWVKDMLVKLDARTWWILGSVVIGFLIAYLGIFLRP